MYKLRIFSSTLFQGLLYTALSLACLHVSPSFSATKEATLEQLQQVLDNYRAKMHIPGMAMSITSHDKRNPHHYVLVSGTTTLHGANPVEASNLFQVGSITKSFTAAIVLQLETNPQYNFNINQPLSTWLPQYPQWGDITVKQLLNHTSGIYNYTDSITDDMTNKQWTLQELVAIAAKHPLYFKPGHGWHYSNTNYTLAAMVVQVLTGKTISEEMESLIAKAKLHDTYYLARPYPLDILSRMVHGYNKDKKDITEENMSWANAAGAIVSNAADIDKWTNELLTPKVILPKKQLLEMQSVVCQKKSTKAGCQYPGMPTTTSNAPTYGLGIAHYKKLWWHDGSTGGYSAIFIYYIPKKFTISITADIGDIEMTNDFHALTQKVSEILLKSTNALTVR